MPHSLRLLCQFSHSPIIFLPYNIVYIQYVCNPRSMYTLSTYIYTTYPSSCPKKTHLSFHCSSTFLLFHSHRYSPHLCILFSRIFLTFLPMTSYVAISATLILFSHCPFYPKNCYLFSNVECGMHPVFAFDLVLHFENKVAFV